MDYKQKRTRALDNAQSIVDSALRENRPMTSDEQGRFDSLLSEANQAADAIRADAARNPLRSILAPRATRLDGSEWVARELRTLVPLSGSGASIDPTSVANYVLDTLTLESTFLASGVIQTVLADGVGQSLTIPTTTTDATTYNLGAGTAITASDPTIGTTVATPRKYAALTYVSNEVLADAHPDVIAGVGRSLIKSVARAFDLEAYTGSGTAPAITGLANVASIGTVSMGTNGAALTNVDNFAEAIGKVRAAGGSPSAIVVGTRTLTELTKLKVDSSSNLPLLVAGGSQAGVAQATPFAIAGVQVFVSDQLPANETQGTASNCQSAFVYDASRVHAVFRRRANTADLVSLERDSSAGFASDLTYLRAVLRATVAVPHAGAVCKIVGIKP